MRKAKRVKEFISGWEDVFPYCEDLDLFAVPSLSDLRYVENVDWVADRSTHRQSLPAFSVGVRLYRISQGG